MEKKNMVKIQTVNSKKEFDKEKEQLLNTINELRKNIKELTNLIKK